MVQQASGATPQETAGTISKTILKNEMLPLLLNEQKRADRAYLLGEQAKRKAAAEAAKKAEEEAKYVPDFKVGYGGLYKTATKSEADKLTNEAYAVVKDQTIPRYEAKRKVGENNAKIEFLNQKDKQLEQEYNAINSDINKNEFFTVPATAPYTFAESQTTPWQPSDVYRQHVLNQAEYVDFDKIGKQGENYKIVSYNIEEPNAKSGERITVSKLFDYELRDDPSDIYGNKKVAVITGVNGAEAQELIASNSKLKHAYDVWVKTEADKKVVNTGMAQVDAENEAAKEFMNKAFAKYGKIEYGKYHTPIPKTPSGPREPKAQPGTKTLAGPRDREFYGGKVARSVGGSSDEQYTLKSKQPIKSGTKIYLIGGTDKDVLKDLVDGGYLAASSDGSYATKKQGQYEYAIPTRLSFAKQDITYKNSANQIVKIKKGSEIHPDDFREISAAYRGKPNPIETINGYESEYEINNQKVYGFVPEAYGSSIKTEIGKIK